MNDSATGGYIVPTNAIPDPLEDDALITFLQSMVKGVTGLPGNMVRPRWQPEDISLPAYGSDWAAVGVIKQAADTASYERHRPGGNGDDLSIRHEVFDLMCSFYGPNADGNGSRLRDGLQIPQNREAMFLIGMGLVRTGPLTKAPVLIKARWLNRSDVTVTLRREIRRAYPVLNLLQAPGSIVTGTIRPEPFNAGP